MRPWPTPSVPAAMLETMLAVMAVRSARGVPASWLETKSWREGGGWTR